VAMRSTLMDRGPSTTNLGWASVRRSRSSSAAAGRRHPAGEFFLGGRERAAPHDKRGRITLSGHDWWTTSAANKAVRSGQPNTQEAEAN